MSQTQALIEVNERSIGDESVQTVNARELHAFLAIGKDFSNWIKAQVERTRLVENRDFVKVALKGELGGQTRIEYFLTLDASKHIAMMSGSDKGFEIREYFIECERAAKAAPVINLNDPAFLRSTLLTYTERVIALEAKITEQEPKVNALRRIAEAEGSFCISDAAKMLQMPPQKLFAKLHEMRWIFKRVGCKYWLGYQDKTQAGLLVHKSTLVTREDGTEKVAEQVRITGRGIARVATLLGAAVVEVAEAAA